MEITISEPEAPEKIIYGIERDFLRELQLRLGKIKQSQLAARGHQRTRKVAKDVGKSCEVLQGIGDAEEEKYVEKGLVVIEQIRGDVTMTELSEKASQCYKMQALGLRMMIKTREG